MKVNYVVSKYGFFIFTVAVGGLFMGQPAHALNPSSGIEIDGGPLGQLQLSGAVSGYFYAQSGTSSTESGSILGNKTTGANLGDLLISLEKSTGILQFTLQLGAVGGTPVLGVAPTKASTTFYREGPLYQGYITIAPPGSPVTFSIGQLASPVGAESGFTWQNSNLFVSDLYYVENSSAPAVEMNLNQGPLSLLVSYGSSWDTGVFNTLQGLASYSFNSNNVVSLFYTGNLGRTGLHTTTYNNTPVSIAGANFMNSQLFGGDYSYTNGNLNIISEVQYVYAKANASLNIPKYTSNFGALAITNYQFAGTPYSLGALAQYFSSIGDSYWYIAPRSEGIGFEITPTWQYKHLYARTSIDYMHLLNGSYAGDGVTGAYGNLGHGRNVVQVGLEGGITF